MELRGCCRAPRAPLNARRALSAAPRASQVTELRKQLSDAHATISDKTEALENARQLVGTDKGEPPPPAHHTFIIISSSRSRLCCLPVSVR
jgi:hypothetical protein